MADILDKRPVDAEMTIFKTEVDPNKLNACIDNILMRLDRLETSMAKTVNQWISVKDRLPEKDGNYLCYLECGAVCEAAFDSTIASEGEEFPFGEWVGVYNSDTLGFTDSYWAEYDAITHWMPLPESPKDGDVNE